MEGIGPALRAGAPPGVTVSVTGFEQIQAVGSSTGGVAPSVLAEALIAGVAALAVLLFVYGSAVAIVPLLIAVPSILTTFLLVSGLTKVTDVSFLVQYLVAVLGLGIAVDYSLLLITRWREEREAGRSNEEGATLIVRRRWAAGILGLAIVAGLAAPALSMNTGQPRANSLGGNGQPAMTLHALERIGVPSAVVFPIQVLTHGGASEVGGNTAQNVDFNRAVYGNFPLMLAAIALLTFLLLARTFRSAVLAAKAVLVNVVSLGASFGFLVLFWQHGFGSNLIYGVPATGSIRNWVPIVSFAFLFGISMDYEVFILARMREEYDRTRSTREAVVGALARTGRLVTCAAVILAISFASLSSAPDVVVEMIATGLGVGIFVDAVVVRTLLVPALVAIMGRWNWWLPGGLARLLRVPPTTTAGHLAGAKHPVGR